MVSYVRPSSDKIMATFQPGAMSVTVLRTPYHIPTDKGQVPNVPLGPTTVEYNVNWGLDILDISCFVRLEEEQLRGLAPDPGLKEHQMSACRGV